MTWGQVATKGGTLTVPDTEYVPYEAGIVLEVTVQTAALSSVQVPAQCAHGTGFGDHRAEAQPGF
jgi:hypothetical protein